MSEEWEKARDEVLDQMAGEQEYYWHDVEEAVDMMVEYWRMYG